jgi:uncharacterized repeat protein (TIGR03803 family)
MNSKGMLTLRVFTMCCGIALGTLIILPFKGAGHNAHAQNTPAERVVYNFSTATGYGPIVVIRDPAGNLYVATQEGGSNKSCTNGCGNILKLSPPGKPTLLYNFTPAAGNAPPSPVGLIRDANGNLYGTTYQGGRFSKGSVFRIAPSGGKKTLHDFDPTTGDGSNPGSGVTIDSAGNLYGTTGSGGGTGCGGAGCGTIYKLTPSGSETILYSFTGSTDGREPGASPVLDASGNLYGTAFTGGVSCIQSEVEGCGTVWKLDTSGDLTVLYTFTGGTDGANPETGLVMDSSGNLYGDALNGGDLSCAAPYGCGVVFEINSSGNFTVLHAFAGSPADGEAPDAALLRDSAGNLYGTTPYGGDQSCEDGCGVAFKLDTSGNEIILHAFAGGATDGMQPGGALISDGNGNLYGATYLGGVANGGVIFAVRAY